MYSGRSIIRANDQMTTKPFPPVESARQKREELEIRQRPVVSNMSQQSYRYSLSIFCVSHIPVYPPVNIQNGTNTTENDDEDVVDDKAVVVIAFRFKIH